MTRERGPSRRCRTWNGATVVRRLTRVKRLYQPCLEKLRRLLQARTAKPGTAKPGKSMCKGTEVNSSP